MTNLAIVEAERLGPAETAACLRAELKRDFPGVTFSVRTRVYAGGSSIDIRWTDGPCKWQVERIAKAWQGRDFDGMTDSDIFHNRTFRLSSGRIVQASASFIFCERTMSPALAARLVRMLVARDASLADVLVVHDEGQGRAYVDVKGSIASPEYAAVVDYRANLHASGCVVRQKAGR